LWCFSWSETTSQEFWELGSWVWNRMGISQPVHTQHQMTVHFQCGLDANFQNNQLDSPYPQLGIGRCWRLSAPLVLCLWWFWMYLGLWHHPFCGFSGTLEMVQVQYHNTSHSAYLNLPN
jgi:hypothetical protein